MKEDLLMEYMKFKAVADIQASKLENEHQKEMIKYRLELLRRRFEDYDSRNLDLEVVRKLEKDRLDMMHKMNQQIFGVLA